MPCRYLALHCNNITISKVLQAGWFQLEPRAGSIITLTLSFKTLENKQSWLASFQGDHSDYNCSKEPDCWKLWWFTLFLRQYIQISPGWHPNCRFPPWRTPRVRSAVFALSQCLLCQIYFGLRVEQFCPSAKAAQPQVREIKLHFCLLICLISYYWIQGTNTMQSTVFLEFSLPQFSNRYKTCLKF